MFIFNENLNGSKRLIAYAFLSALIFICLSARGLAQDPPPQEEKVIRLYDKPNIEDPQKLLGKNTKVLFERRYARPIGALKVRGIKWEEIPLTETLELGKEKGTHRIDRAMRILISSDLDPGECTIWVGDQRYHSDLGGPNMIAFLVFGRWQFEDGAEIKIARGWFCQAELDKRTVLPDKLVVPDEYKIVPPKKPESYIESVRSYVNPDNGALGVQNPILVKFRLVLTSFAMGGTNNVFVAQVGDEEFNIGVDSIEQDRRDWDGTSGIFVLTKQQFDRLEQGRSIYLKFGKCSSGGTFLGRVDKAMLDQQR